MLARYMGSIAAGAIVTAALIYWMQLLVDHEPAVAPAHGRVVLTAPSLPSPPETRPRPPRPNPLVTPPAPASASVPPANPTTARNEFVGLVTPTWPSGPPGHPGGRPGSDGPWAFDSDLLLVASIVPSYPFAALRRELEGYVIVEFTVTRTGEVADAHVVESTDPVFEQAALDSVVRSRFRPRIVDGAPRSVSGLRKQIVFTLDE